MAPSRRHLSALDVVRVVTVATVISVHALSLLLPGRPGAAGGVLVVGHSSREVFLGLSAMVLTWAADARPVPPRVLWRRRVPLVAVPYLAWSVVYFVAGGSSGGAGRLALDLLDGGAHFHLYFLLLSLQLYLVMPWLLRWLRGGVARQWASVALAGAAQLGFTAVVHWHLGVVPPLSWLATHPGTWLVSYPLFVVAGVVVGLHAEAATAWCAGHLRLLAALAAVVVTMSVGAYAVSVTGGAAPGQASEVFQPAVMVEAVSLGALELGAGSLLTARAGRRQLRRLVAWSDLSFGVYLLHPLLLEAALDHTDVARELAALPPAVAVAAVVSVVVPVVAALSGVAVAALRATPLSLAATGRPWRRRWQDRPVVALRRAAAVTAIALGAAAVTVGGAREAVAHEHPRPPAPTTWQSSDVGLTYGGLARSYLVVQPTATTTRLPVVVMLHGHSVTPETEESRDDWPAVTGAAVVVLPAGTGTGVDQGWDAGSCCGTAQAAGVDDVGFVEAVVRRVLATDPRADATRVYLAGYSNGGKLALTLACDDPAQWRGVAVYAATAVDECAHQAPVSLLLVASKGDASVPIVAGGPPVTDSSGGVEPPVDTEAATYAAADGCGPATPSGSPALAETTWACPGGRRVTEALYAGGSHALPVATAAVPGVVALMWGWCAGLPG